LLASHDVVLTGRTARPVKGQTLFALLCVPPTGVRTLLVCVVGHLGDVLVVAVGSFAFVVCVGHIYSPFQVWLLLTTTLFKRCDASKHDD
jgi:hypothetical protein